ncbi:hypothetical protein PCIT_a4381 [Pseudoalteromonas citrea]|uniref:Uncharacterized protein n=1 Tax=Pseudoalteromonas citrea TaxID=43655 RepID=A0AAD4AG34_9GAMM|nr:hypothetical protein PCIT_a4381 [Pseudoalteromonas citrea]
MLGFFCLYLLLIVLVLSHYINDPSHWSNKINKYDNLQCDI